MSELVDQRHVLQLLVQRDLRLRYAGTVLGYVWTILEPLMMALVYWFVFTVIFPRGSVGEDPYILFLLVGMLPWNWFATCLNTSCKALTSEAKTVRSANMPREIWVARVVASKMFEFVFAIPIIVVFAVVLRQGVSWQIVFFPVALVLQFLLSFGLGLILAPLSVLVNDVQNVVRIVVRVGFYVTPVIYGLSNLKSVPEPLQVALSLNPMAGIVSLYRLGFWPHQEGTHVGLFVSAFVTTAVTLAIGVAVFRRLEGEVLKEI